MQAVLGLLSALLPGLLPGLLTGLLTGLLAAGLALPAAAADLPPLQRIELQHQGQTRHALLQWPAGVDPARAPPLLLAFHGGGGHAEFMADDARYGLRSLAQREGWILLLPNGHSRFPGGRLATWNAGGCCGDARDRGIDDVGFVRALVAELARRGPLDAGRIWATGMSNGGMMAYRLACEAADLVAAIAAVAGTEALAEAECRPSRPVSVLHLHARDDSHVLYDGGAGADAFRDRSKVMDFVGVPQTLQRWQQRLHCAATAQTVLQRPGVRCEAWSGCDAGVGLQLCSSDTGGHSWPGAQRVRMGKTPATQSLSATERMAECFKAAPTR